ncbi:hypothetical protein [Leifsonia sp. LS-T14]|uniref:hypothetical protein n=1 Tax=unclassified Leifsonia TaxID=2663824 RepID=UPI0035A57529
MTLDTYADLFEDHLDEGAERLDEGRRANLPDVWARSKIGASPASGKGPNFRVITRISNNA